MAKSRAHWPEWWSWELDCTNPHLAKRMTDRGFNEADLREMLDRATSFEADAVPGRWLVTTVHERVTWEVVVEPDQAAHVLIVVTAYHLR